MCKEARKYIKRAADLPGHACNQGVADKARKHRPRNGTEVMWLACESWGRMHGNFRDFIKLILEDFVEITSSGYITIMIIFEKSLPFLENSNLPLCSVYNVQAKSSFIFSYIRVKKNDIFYNEILDICIFSMLWGKIRTQSLVFLSYPFKKLCYTFWSDNLCIFALFSGIIS